MPPVYVIRGKWLLFVSYLSPEILHHSHGTRAILFGRSLLPEPPRRNQLLDHVLGVLGRHGGSLSLLWKYPKSVGKVNKRNWLWNANGTRKCKMKYGQQPQSQAASRDWLLELCCVYFELLTFWLSVRVWFGPWRRRTSLSLTHYYKEWIKQYQQWWSMVHHTMSVWKNGIFNKSCTQKKH